MESNDIYDIVATVGDNGNFNNTFDQYHPWMGTTVEQQQPPPTCFASVTIYYAPYIIPGFVPL